MRGVLFKDLAGQLRKILFRQHTFILAIYIYLFSKGIHEFGQTDLGLNSFVHSELPSCLASPFQKAKARTKPVAERLGTSQNMNGCLRQMRITS